MFFLCSLYWVAACPVPWVCAVCCGLLLVVVGVVISVACLLCVVCVWVGGCGGVGVVCLCVCVFCFAAWSFRRPFLLGWWLCTACSIIHLF